MRGGGGGTREGVVDEFLEGGEDGELKDFADLEGVGVGEGYCAGLFGGGLAACGGWWRERDGVGREGGRGVVCFFEDRFGSWRGHGGRCGVGYRE